MRTLVRNTLLALALTALAAPLAAQEIRPLHSSGGREGFWWGIGLASASASAECSTCPDLDNQSFPMLDIRLGGTLSPQWRLGVQLTGGQKTDGFFEDPDFTETVGDLNVSAFFYPSASGNFWLQGGVTAVVFQGEDDADNKITYTGPGLTLGGGYDFRVGRNMSITPSLRAAVGGEGDIKDQDDNVLDDAWKSSFVEFAVSVVWH